MLHIKNVECVPELFLKKSNFPKGFARWLSSLDFSETLYEMQLY